MNKIIIKEVTKSENAIKVKFEATENLKQFLRENEFWCEYNTNVEKTPSSIAVIPFVANVLPIIWLTDATLIVPELDKSFYDSIPKFKKAYKKMLSITLKGKLETQKLICNVNNKKKSPKSLLYYSGGVDSYSSLVNHYYENLDLVSIWGSDINIDEEKEWNNLNDHLKKNLDIEEKHFEQYIIKTNFRAFLNYPELQTLIKQYGYEYWHDFQHGIGLISLSSPLAYVNNYKKIYFASSHIKKDGNVICASRPNIDGNVRFSQTRVIHDGFKFSRQNKVDNIVKFYSNKNKPTLHICWENHSGDNCSHCEKCCRTIMEILLANGNPSEYGFNIGDSTFSEMEKILYDVNHRLPRSTATHWLQIKNGVKKRKDLSQDPNINWLLSFDTEIIVCENKIQKRSIFRRVLSKIKRILKKILRKN